MKKSDFFRYIIVGLSPLFFLTSAAGAPESPELKKIDLRRLFEKVDEHFSHVENLSLKVERHLTRGKQEQTERWQATFKQPDLMRIEVERSKLSAKRIILATGNAYSEYLPEVNRAMEVDLSKMPEAKQSEFYAQLMPRIAIPGFRLALVETLWDKMNFELVRLENLEGRQAYFIRGQDNRKNIGKENSSQGRMHIWIDKERQTILKVEVYDGDRFVSSIENKSFWDSGDGHWFPNRVLVRNSTPSALEKAEYRVSRIQINQDLAADFFKPRYADGVQVIDGNATPPSK